MAKRVKFSNKSQRFPIPISVSRHRGNITPVGIPNIIEKNFSIQSYDSQYELVVDNTTLGNYDETDAFSISTKFKWDLATQNESTDAVSILSNYTAGNNGWFLEQGRT